ncbi:hypothetical protein A6C57_01395 [Fibrella sp. ES10-3-2-2]|nr:hypothetical protein A6C57_01395 [Fibrella sp. ES10-3-2-2]
MKTLICSWIILGVTAVGAFANPGTKKISKAKPQASIEQQLANQLTYPSAMQQATGNGVVVIQFRLANDNKLVNPTVFSADKRLNDELTKQLMNAKLSLSEISNSDEVHTARLRFKAAE